jgi:hypothetical protein
MKVRSLLEHSIASLCAGSILVGCIMTDDGLAPRKPSVDGGTSDGGTSDGGSSDDDVSRTSETTAAVDAGKPTSSAEASSSSDDTELGTLNDGGPTSAENTSDAATNPTSDAATTDDDSTRSTSSETLTSETLVDASTGTSSDAITLPEAELCTEGFYRPRADAQCVPHSVCSPGSHVVTPGTARTDTVCAPCPNGTFSNLPNASQCTPHTECGSTYYELTAPTATQDRVCECQQTCEDGRCIAENACCEPTEPGTEFRLMDGNNTTLSFSFCIESQTALLMDGATWSPTGESPTVVLSASLYNGGTALGSWWFDGSTTGGTMPYTLAPGTYDFTLEVSSGVGYGVVSATLH